MLKTVPWQSTCSVTQLIFPSMHLFPIMNQNVVTPGLLLRKDIYVKAVKGTCGWEVITM